MVFTTTDSLALPLNWIHLKTICEATVRIIGLTKIPKIEFLPLDWIYCCIQIMIVFCDKVPGHVRKLHHLIWICHLFFQKRGVYKLIECTNRNSTVIYCPPVHKCSC